MKSGLRFGRSHSTPQRPSRSVLCKGRCLSPTCLAPCQVPGTPLPPGASHCTCRGLNRVFQKSDGSCICQAGYKSYDDDESSSEEDCQPQVALGPQWGRQREGSTIHTVSLPSRVGMTSCVSGKHLGSLPVIKPQGLSFAKGLGSLPCGG